MIGGQILIVDDEGNITSSFSDLLADEGYHTETAATGEKALEKCAGVDFDLVLLDLNLPGISGLDVLRELNREASPPTVLVISGQSDIPTAVDAVRLGACDYLEKPVAPEKLISSVKAAVMLARSRRSRRIMADEIDRHNRITGTSAPMKKLLETVSQAAPSDVTVLISGENGTGKELIATRLYLESKRRDRPFIKVNCPGIPETLFESELFGHRKGAFTGAVKDYPGKFVMAHGGTIFLDEIGDLPAECQAKLLRVIETGEVETLGATEKRQVDVRIVCATNRKLPDLVARGTFREDLFYRISVFVIEVPSLRQHADDIPLLIGEFLGRFDPSGATRLTPEAVACLGDMDYPGNIRQLKNIIERLSITHSGRLITPADILDQPQSVVNTVAADESLSLPERVRRFEKHLLETALREHGGNISHTAQYLKIDRANLSRKLKELGLRLR